MMLHKNTFKWRPVETCARNSLHSLQMEAKSGLLMALTPCKPSYTVLSWALLQMSDLGLNQALMQRRSFVFLFLRPRKLHSTTVFIYFVYRL